MDNGLEADSAPRLCGAPLKRAAQGFCRAPAGYGTDHRGSGHCHIHGGKPENVPEGAFETAPDLVNRAASLTDDDVEALYSLSVRAWVICLAQYSQSAMQVGRTTKEINELTLSIGRLNALLRDHPEFDNPDAPAHETDPLDEELKRLLEIEAEFDGEADAAEEEAHKEILDEADEDEQED